jgi:hypothetical protein
MLAYRADRVKIRSLRRMRPTGGKKLLVQGRLVQGRNDIIIQARDDTGLGGV